MREPEVIDEGIVCADCGAHEPFGHYDEDDDVDRCDACHEAAVAAHKETTR